MSHDTTGKLCMCAFWLTRSRKPLSRKPEAESGRSYGVVVASAEVRSSDEDFPLYEKLHRNKGKKPGPVGNLATFLRRSRKRYKVLKAKKVVDEPVAANVGFLDSSISAARSGHLAKPTTSVIAD